MPLRDHFRPPLDNLASWEQFHAQWPAMIVLALQRLLPRRYIAGPSVRSGTSIEVDVGTFEQDESTRPPETGNGGVATAVWAPPRPTFTVATDVPQQDEYEVLVYDSKRARRLVAAIEIVSPANKDRPEHRRLFVAKCAALLQKLVSVTIVDLVTTCNFNLYCELLELLGLADPSLRPQPPPLYAVASRWTEKGDAPVLETWTNALVLGEPLPTLPLWLAENLSVPLELEASYEETCRVLRIP